MKKILLILLFGLPLFATSQIAFVNALGSNNAGGGGTITMNMPSGVSNGQTLIMNICAVGGTGTAITTPTGWTLEVIDYNTTAIVQAIYSRTASSEPSSYVVTLTSAKASGTITAISGGHIDYSVSGQLISLQQTTRAWQGIAANSSTGDVIAAVSGTDLYKQTAGAGNFVAMGLTARSYVGVAINPSNNDVYTVVRGGDIYKQTAGTGAFNALNATGATKIWVAIAVNPTNGDVYASVENGDIYKQTAGTGAFNALGAGTRAWQGIAINSTTGDVYVVEESVDIWKQTASSGSFVAMGLTARVYYDITVNPSNNDVFVAVFGGDVYRQIGGSGSFVATGQTSRSWLGITVNSTTGAVYATVSNGGIYKMINGAFTSSVNASSATVTASGYPNFSTTVNGIDLFLGGTATGTTVLSAPTNYTNAAQSTGSGGGVASRTTSNIAYRSLTNVLTVGSLTETMNAAAVNIGQRVFITETTVTAKPRRLTFIK